MAIRCDRRRTRRQFRYELSALLDCLTPAEAALALWAHCHDQRLPAAVQATVVQAAASDGITAVTWCYQPGEHLGDGDVAALVAGQLSGITRLEPGSTAKITMGAAAYRVIAGTRGSAAVEDAVTGRWAATVTVPARASSVTVADLGQRARDLLGVRQRERWLALTACAGRPSSPRRHHSQFAPATEITIVVVPEGIRLRDTLLSTSANRLRSDVVSEPRSTGPSGRPVGTPASTAITENHFGAGRADPSGGPTAPAGDCPPHQPCNWSGPGTHGRPGDTSAARPANGRAIPATRSGHADHPPAVPAFRKLDAVAVLTARLLPAPRIAAPPDDFSIHERSSPFLDLIGRCIQVVPGPARIWPCGWTGATPRAAAPFKAARSPRSPISPSATPWPVPVTCRWR